MRAISLLSPNFQEVRAPVFDNFADKYVPESMMKAAPGLIYLIQSIYNVFRGVNEIISRRVRHLTKRETAPQTIPGRIKAYCLKFFEEFKTSFTQLRYHAAHGFLYATTGIFGSFIALHDLEKINLGKGLSIIKGFEIVSSIFAGIIGLDYFIQAYDDASKLPPDATKAEIDAAQRIKTSAIFGLVECIGLIIAGAIAIFTGTAIIAFIIGCIGSLSSCFKTLHDFFYCTTV